MLRLIVLSAAAIPVALAFSAQNQESATPARTLAEAASTQEETPASIWWADYDADGLEDALAIDGAGAPQLLRNLGDGEFANETQAAGLAGVSGARFAAWGDVDGDGAPDVYVGTQSGPKLFVNQKGGAFTEAAARSGLAHTSADRDAHFLDYDHDRQLDLHVQTAAGDLLYRGVGAGQFQRVELGLKGAAAAGTTVVAGAHEHAETPAAPAAAPASGDGDRSARSGASGAAPTRTAGQPTNPVTTRQPAPVPPGGYSSVPCAFVNASASSVFDQTTNQCLLASTQGTIGNLYPLSNDFNVNAAGNVGIGVNNASDRLHVNNGDIRVTGSAGREVVVFDGAGGIAMKLDADAAGAANNIELRKGNAVAHDFTPNGNGYIQQHFNTSGGAPVVRGGNSADQSGYWDILSPTGAIMVQIDADVGGASSTNGRVWVRSAGTGGPGGELRIDDNTGGLTLQALGGDGVGTGSTLEFFDTAGNSTFVIGGGTTSGSRVLGYNSAGIETIDIDSDVSGGGQMAFSNGVTSSARVFIDGDGGDDGGLITVYAADGSAPVVLDGEAENSGGAVSVRNDITAETVRIVGDDGANSGLIGMWDRSGTAAQTVLVEANDAFGTGASFIMYQPNGNVAVDFDGGGNTGSVFFDLREGDGSSMYTFSGNTQFIKNDAGSTTISHNGNTGAKSAVQMTDSYGQRLLYCMESPEVWFEDFGTASLVNGVARVDLDPMFLETITVDEQNPMKVFVSLNGDSEGVWIEKGDTYFVVHERAGGTSDVAFDWRLVAKRRGLEEFRLDPFFEPTDPDGDDAQGSAGKRAPQDGDDKVVEEVFVRRPSADEREAVVDDNTDRVAAQSADAPERQ